MAIPGIGSYLSNVAMARGSSSVKELFEPAAPAKSEAKPTGGSIIDELELSTAGQAAADLRPTMYRHPLSRADGAIHIPDVLATAQTEMADFSQKLQGILDELGIDTSAGIRLETDARGQVRVIGDHPQKEAIEQAFVDNPELRDQFAFISSSLQLARAAREAHEFQKAYADDPQAAIAQFSHLFDATQKKQPVGLILQEGVLSNDPPLFTEGN